VEVKMGIERRAAAVDEDRRTELRDVTGAALPRGSLDRVQKMRSAASWMAGSRPGAHAGVGGQELAMPLDAASSGDAEG
jgi:hypothetical protein